MTWQVQKELFPHEYELYQTVRQKQGKFYAVPPQGESRMNVALRTRQFKETMMRDFKGGQEDVVVIAHGVTNRALEMDFMHKGVEWFEKEPNPGNCDITLIEGDHTKGYTATKIYEGKIRTKSLPDGYKTAAHDSGMERSPPGSG